MPFPQLEVKGNCGRWEETAPLQLPDGTGCPDGWPPASRTHGAITSAPVQGPCLGLKPSSVYIALVYRGSLRACQHHSSPWAGWGSPDPQLQGEMDSRAGKPREKRKQGLQGLEDTRRWGTNCP